MLYSFCACRSLRVYGGCWLIPFGSAFKFDLGSRIGSGWSEWSSMLWQGRIHENSWDCKAKKWSQSSYLGIVIKYLKWDDFKMYFCAREWEILMFMVLMHKVWSYGQGYWCSWCKFSCRMCEHNDFDTLRILSTTLLELSYVINLFVEKMFGIILNVAYALQICFKTFVRWMHYMYYDVLQLFGQDFVL